MNRKERNKKPVFPIIPNNREGHWEGRQWVPDNPPKMELTPQSNPNFDPNSHLFISNNKKKKNKQ